jgi:hypothetical protein
MTTTFATILELFTTGSAPIGLLAGAIALIVGLNFWMESRDALETPRAEKVRRKVSDASNLQGMPLATSQN